MAILETIESLLTTESNIYIGEYPADNPDDCCTITLIPGRPSQHVMGQPEAIFRNPSIQILVRDTSFSEAYDRCEAIVGILDGYNGPGIMSCFLESDIVSVGKDDNNRSELYMIYRLMV